MDGGDSSRTISKALQPHPFSMCVARMEIKGAVKLATSINFKSPIHIVQ
jgi:hypothetical protein